MARMFDDREVYELDEIAARLEEKRKWVYTNLIHKGLRHRKVGERTLVSGRQINLWVEAGDQRWDENDEETDET